MARPAGHGSADAVRLARSVRCHQGGRLREARPGKDHGVRHRRRPPELFRAVRDRMMRGHATASAYRIRPLSARRPSWSRSKASWCAARRLTPASLRPPSAWPAPLPETSKFENTFCTSSSSSRPAISFRIDAAFSSSTEVVRLRLPHRLDEAGSPNFPRARRDCAEALERAGDSAHWRPTVRVGARLDGRLQHGIGAAGAGRIDDLADVSEHVQTAPVAPRLPPCLVKTARTAPPVRLRLSLSASTMMATPPGP